MAIPDITEIRRPALLFLAKHPEQHVDIRQELAPAIAEQLNLAKEKNASHERSGVEFFPNFVFLACLTLSKEGLIEKTIRGCVRITQEGQNYLEAHPGKISKANIINCRAAYEKWKAARRKLMLREGKPANGRPAHEKRKAIRKEFLLREGKPANGRPAHEKRKAGVG